MTRIRHGIGIVSEIATMFGYAQAMGRAIKELDFAVTS
jgi:hypothetical protein